MRRMRWGVVSAALVAMATALFFGWPLLAEVTRVGNYLFLGGMSPDEPQILVTVEYMTVDQLLDPRTMDIAKRNKLWIAPCVRANALDANLDRLAKAYKAAGIGIVYWPLLPREQCLYLNTKHVDDFLAHLDKMYAWADQYGNTIEAIIIDIEPENCQKGTDAGPEAADPDAGLGIGDAINKMDKKKFMASIEGFNRVLKKLHEHNTVAISTAMDYAATDIQNNRTVFQDLSGGPSLLVDWDMVSFMNFGSQNTKFLKEALKGLGIDWTVKDTRYLSYLMCRLIAKKYGNRAAISLGQTIPGEGHGAVWTDPADLGRDAAVCKYAGIVHFGIYDFQGIVESDNPDAWIAAVRDAKPTKPEYSAKAVTLWNLVNSLYWYGEMKRSF